jgi:hypothetical protein
MDPGLQTALDHGMEKVAQSMSETITLPEQLTAESLVREFSKSFKTLGSGMSGGFYDYLIEHQNSGKLEPLNKEEREFLKESLRGWRPKAQCCFQNAQTLATRYHTGRIKYHEGVIITGDLPVPLDHAWNSINGKLVDVTLAANNRKFKREAKKAGEEYEPRVYSYCGVIFSNTDIHKAQLKSGVYANVLPWIGGD